MRIAQSTSLRPVAAIRSYTKTLQLRSFTAISTAGEQLLLLMRFTKSRCLNSVVGLNSRRRCI